MTIYKIQLPNKKVMQFKSVADARKYAMKNFAKINHRGTVFIWWGKLDDNRFDNYAEVARYEHEFWWVILGSARLITPKGNLAKYEMDSWDIVN